MISSSFYFRYYFILFSIILFIVILCVPILQHQDIEISDFSNSIQFLVSEDFAWPLPGFSRISSKYGERKSPTTGASSFHYGIDFPAPPGTAFVSSINGHVIYADFDRCKWFYNKN